MPPACLKKWLRCSIYINIYIYKVWDIITNKAIRCKGKGLAKSQKKKCIFIFLLFKLNFHFKCILLSAYFLYIYYFHITLEPSHSSIAISLLLATCKWLSHHVQTPLSRDRCAVPFPSASLPCLVHPAAVSRAHARRTHGACAQSPCLPYRRCTPASILLSVSAHYAVAYPASPPHRYAPGTVAYIYCVGLYSGGAPCLHLLHDAGKWVALHESFSSAEPVWLFGAMQPLSILLSFFLFLG